MAGGGTRTQKNKVHKTRFASKSSRHTHKTDKPGVGLPARRASVAAAARTLRMQRSKDVRDKKRAQVLAEKRSSHGLGSPPVILALVALSSQVRLDVLKRRLLAASLREGSTADAFLDGMDDIQPDLETVAVPRLKTRLTVITAPYNDTQVLLEVAKVADIVAFVTTATVEGHEELIDTGGKRCLSVFRVQGAAASVGFVLGLDSIPAKKRTETRRVAVSALQGELAEGSKIFTVDSGGDCQQMLRHLSEKRMIPPIWRSQRPYLLAHKVDFAENPSGDGKGTLRLWGYVRGRALSVNQLVHVPGAGDFQLEKLDVLDDPTPLRLQQRVSEDAEANSMLVDKPSRSLIPSTELQEPLIIANVPDTLAGEQTWPTETELGMAQNAQAHRLQKKRLPKGTSKYQASWIVDEGSDLEPENDDDDTKDEDMAETADMDEGRSQLTLEDDEQSVVSEVDGREDVAFPVFDADEAQSEMMDDEELTAAPKDGELEQLKAVQVVDEEFPDHVDTPSNIPARQRFAKYRGLKSFRTSSWDAKESLPQEYAKIFAFQNLNRTRKYILGLAEQADEDLVAGCVGVGTYVLLHVSNVPSGLAGNLLTSADRKLIVACGLLKHESKMSVLHFSVKKNDDFASKVRSKEELLFHSGFRQFSARPIFSTDSLNADKHKFERFLQSGQFLVATVFAPVTFSPVPVVVLKEDGEGIYDLVASGSLKTVDPHRIILKKLVLSGYPQRVSKRKAVVRFMFHNPEDVRWFKPVDLWSKYGRRGRIQEPVGTHGAMKCIFDGVIQQRDSVCLSLYKRVYPKWSPQE